MAILVDYSQVFISNLMQQPGIRDGVEEDLVRHMVLNSLRSYRKKFKEDYGELIICCDNKKYWRKDIFPYYKSHRKANRKQSDFDWNEIFTCLNKVKAELIDNFPYLVFEVENVEADDIIAVYCMEYDGSKLILSGDKDFVQLQSFKDYPTEVHQYNPMKKAFIYEKHPEKYLRQHIMRGDRGDGIPNFLSDDDCFVNGGRQKPLRSGQLEKWSEIEDPAVFCDQEMLRGYRRNEMLVDLTKIPDEIKNKIIQVVDETKEIDRSKIFPYFVQHKLKNLTEYIHEF